MRTPLSEPDRRFIIGRSGGCCNKCTTPVFLENEFGEAARLGDDAHIWAYSDDGPRGNLPNAPVNRNVRTNIILLCKNCHSEVDQQKIKFTPDILTAMRENHYAWVKSRLGKDIVEKPKFQYLIYLNMPRLDMYAVSCSLPMPTLQCSLEKATCFRDLGINAGRVMARYTALLNREDIYGSVVKSNISHLEVGEYCFIEPMNFRTVSIEGNGNLPAAWEADRSIVYRNFLEWKLILLIDPRWITTSTAESTLRSGHVELCSAIRINSINTENKKIYASPLFLAQI
ncbi:MAG: hypothetical protein ABF968_11370 [Acetobacter sp.]|uniref:hypothetical protein n=1 Tax=Acetobacter sp. TaxID=440 RepID=UPI0039EA2F59